MTEKPTNDQIMAAAYVYAGAMLELSRSGLNPNSCPFDDAGKKLFAKTLKDIVAGLKGKAKLHLATAV